MDGISSKVVFVNFDPDFHTKSKVQLAVEKLLGESPSDSLLYIFVKQIDRLNFETEIKLVSRTLRFVGKSSGTTVVDAMGQCFDKARKSIVDWRRTRWFKSVV